MLESIKGIGPKTIKSLNKLGIYSIDDLVLFYPFRYDVLEKSDINALEQDDKIIIDGIIESVPTVFYFSKKKNRMTFRVNSDNRILNITIFNRSYLKNKLEVGTNIIVIGKYDKLHNSIIAQEIRFGILPGIPIIEPIYHSNYDISS